MMVLLLVLVLICGDCVGCDCGFMVEFVMVAFVGNIGGVVDMENKSVILKFTSEVDIICEYNTLQ